MTKNLIVYRNAFETQNQRFRAPQYLIQIINITKKFKQVFLLKFNIVHLGTGMCKCPIAFLPFKLKFR